MTYVLLGGALNSTHLAADVG